ncbi:LysM domain-containing protein [Fusarium oxysporum f. sp. albedinis]|nr:LysM domain-containing protein [Fusarium oxysporum f. sp. albedinis]
MVVLPNSQLSGTRPTLPRQEHHYYKYDDDEKYGAIRSRDSQPLERPRASLSPSRFSKDDFKRFKRADDHATKESRVTASVIPIIEGDPGDTRCIASDISFTNLDHLMDGSLVCAKPDLYHRARPEQLHKEDDLPVLPNNFVEVKGPDGSLSVATRQALYDVTLGARGFQSLLSYGAEEPHYDNKACAIAWVYHGGHMKAYASHVLEPSTPEAPPGYAMTQIKGWSLTSDLETFRQGATAYRNGRD